MAPAVAAVSVRAEDVYERLRKMRMDCSAIQSGITDLFSMLNEIGLQDAPEADCPFDGCPLSFRGPNTLAEHVYTSHDGPLPPHWAVLDERVARTEQIHAREAAKVARQQQQQDAREDRRVV